jgi:reverse gyrase
MDQDFAWKVPFQLQRYQVDGIGKLLRANRATVRWIYQSQITRIYAYYSNRFSYKEVEKLVERFTGKQLLSDQKIWQIVSNKALVVSHWSFE